MSFDHFRAIIEPDEQSINRIESTFFILFASVAQRIEQPFPNLLSQLNTQIKRYKKPH